VVGVSFQLLSSLLVSFFSFIFSAAEMLSIVFATTNEMDDAWVKKIDIEVLVSDT
jgi:hypothetical protein